MPTIHHQVVGKCPKACEFTGENTLGRQTLRFFMDKVAPGVAEVRSLFPRLWASICESGRKKCAGCSKSSISQKNIAKKLEQPRICVVESAARVCFDLVRRSCYSGLQAAVTKRIGTAGHRKASMMLRCSWQAGLRLEVAERIVKAAQKVVLDHSAILCYAGLQLEVVKHM